MNPQDELNKKSVKDLRAIAAAVGIDAASMKKPEIIKALLSAGSPDGNEQPKEPEKEEQVKPKRGRPKKIATEAPQEEAKAAAPAKEETKEEQQTPAEEATKTPAPAQPQKRQSSENRSYRNNYTPEQRSAAAFRRDIEKEMERKAIFMNYQDRRQGGYDQQNPRQNGNRAGQQRPYDQRNQSGRYAQDNRFQSDMRRQNDLRQRQSDVRNQGDQPRRDPFGSYPYERTPEPADIDTAKEEARAQEREAQRLSNNEPEAVEVRQPEEEKEFTCYGILEINQNGYGFLRAETLYPGTKDIFVPPPLIRRHLLRTGDMITGKAKPQSKEFNAQYALTTVCEINGIIAENVTSRPTFDSLIPTYPDERFTLEVTPGEYATRIIDMFAPIGKGQRGLIVSPPKAGKTVLLKTIANSLLRNYPDVHLIMLLIDERPEEVTDIKESVNAMVVASTFDEMTSRHVAVSEFCLEHAMRMVEMGEDVVILMDSITRLARAYNQEVTPSGRSLSGGLDPAALYKPKKFFGAARNIKGGGSLTIIATALVDTGSRLDDVIYEEFKGTGNMELHLDRSLAERRIFPSIDITLSGTRKEELLLPPSTLDKIYALRRSFANVNSAKDITEAVIDNLSKTATNKQFLNTIKVPER
ncbi:MAG: transcription termination factor Rho [Clostridia bacterium]|nr:transcription termination factor Rho [Clostridia bacterium]